MTREQWIEFAKIISWSLPASLLMIAGIFWVVNTWPLQTFLIAAACISVMFVWAVLNCIAILLILIFRP